MKIKKTLVSILLLSVLALSSIAFVNAAEEDSDPGGMRPSSYTDPIETTTESSLY